MRKARRESFTATVETPVRANEEAWLSHSNKESPISLTMKSRTGERYVWGAAALILLLAPYCISARPVAKAAGVLLQEHRLLLYHTHTGERLDIVYRLGDDYVPEAIAKLDYFLRDHRTGEIHHFDPKLYDILEDLTVAVRRPGAEIDIVCGYRTPWSNQFLRTHTEGVAKNSLHMQAQAIDLRIPGVETSRLRDVALSLHRGGVGYYPHSNFIHVDTGRVRQWCLGCAARQPAAD
jgi:uncharacterized protein YcbK (DUF882 family)